MDNNPIRNNDPDGDDWWDRVAGAVVGVTTNIVPGSTGLRNLVTPTDADDYNDALEKTDKVVMIAGTAGVITGGGMIAAGGTMAVAGGTVSASGVGAVVGGPTAAAGGVVALDGVIMAAGGGMLMANANNNQNAGYDYGKTKIKIAEKDKIPRNKLNPPKKPGNAPTFKKDGTPVEIHHKGQNPKGPFKEMHKNDHRIGDNFKKNHPSGQKPLTKEDRKQFYKDKKEYWKNEYKQKK